MGYAGRGPFVSWHDFGGGGLGTSGREFLRLDAEVTTPSSNRTKEAAFGTSRNSAATQNSVAIGG